MKNLKWFIPLAALLAVLIIMIRKQNEITETDDETTLDCSKHRNKNISFAFVEDKSIGITAASEETDESGEPLFVFTCYGHAYVTADGKEYTLEEALKRKVITLTEMICKFDNDCYESTAYDDGGSIEYHCKGCSLIKFNTLDGNKDVYIGSEKMTIHDLK